MASKKEQVIFLCTYVFIALFCLWAGYMLATPPGQIVGATIAVDDCYQYKFVRTYHIGDKSMDFYGERHGQPGVGFIGTGGSGPEYSDSIGGYDTYEIVDVDDLGKCIYYSIGSEGFPIELFFSYEQFPELRDVDDAKITLSF